MVPHCCLKNLIIRLADRSETVGMPGPNCLTAPGSSSALRIASGDIPIAYIAAMKAPPLTPPTATTGTPASSSACSTPTAAQPRAPPPLMTTPIARRVMKRASRPMSLGSLARRCRTVSTARCSSHRLVSVGVDPMS
jgi:hypothetical protein